MTHNDFKIGLKELGWVGLFFIVLAAFTLPTILLSQTYSFEVTLFHQAAIVMMTNWICQRLWGVSMRDIWRIDSTMIRHLLVGISLGAALMIIPAIFLTVGGWVRWDCQVLHGQTLLLAITTVIAGAVTEEFLFRGFMFQRLLSFGIWPAQILISAYFLLNHMGNPDMNSEVKVIAMTNIFLASLVFGFTVIQTKKLTMAIALHAGANLVQGTLLGFGVSGHAEQSIFKPTITDAPIWLTGGTFGLEASVPGLLCVIILLWIIHTRKISRLTSKEI